MRQPQARHFPLPPARTPKHSFPAIAGKPRRVLGRRQPAARGESGPPHAAGLHPPQSGSRLPQSKGVAPAGSDTAAFSSRSQSWRSALGAPFPPGRRLPFGERRPGPSSPCHPSAGHRNGVSPPPRPFPKRCANFGNERLNFGNERLMTARPRVARSAVATGATPRPTCAPRAATASRRRARATLWVSVLRVSLNPRPRC